MKLFKSIVQSIFFCFTAELVYKKIIMVSKIQQKSVAVNIFGCSVFFLSCFSFDIYRPCIDGIMEYYDVSAGVFEWIFHSNYISYTLGFLIYLFTAPYVSLRTLAIMGSSFLVSGASWCLLPGSVFVFFVGSSIISVGLAFSVASIYPLVASIFNRKDSIRKIGLFCICAAMARLVGPFCGAQIELVSGNWRINIIFLLTLLSLLLVSTILYWPKTPDLASPFRPSKLVFYLSNMLKNLEFVGYTIIASATTICRACFMVSAPFLLIKYFDLSPVIASLLMAITVASYISGTLLSNKLVLSIDPQRIILWGSWASFLSSVCAIFPFLLWGGDVQSFIFFSSIISFGVGMVFANSFVLSMLPFKEVASISSASANFLRTIFCSFGLTVFGLTHNGTPWPMLICIFLSTSCPLALIYILFRKKFRPISNSGSVASVVRHWDR